MSRPVFLVLDRDGGGPVVRVDDRRLELAARLLERREDLLRLLGEGVYAERVAELRPILADLHRQWGSVNHLQTAIRALRESGEQFGSVNGSLLLVTAALEMETP